MTVAPKSRGRRLSASFNGGHRKITVSSKSHRYYNTFEDVVLPDDLLEEHGQYNRSVNIWWDVGWCPPPLNFDVSKIGITVIDAVRRINTSRPISLRVYGKVGKLLPKMANETIRIISQSGLELALFELKDDGGSNGIADTLMTKDLYHYCLNTLTPPVPIHMVIFDGKVITASYLDGLDDPYYAYIICVEPEQESVDGLWRWNPLWPVRPMRQCKSNGGGNSLDEGGLSNDDANVNAFKIDKLSQSTSDGGGNSLDEGKIVNIWWDFGRCPLPLNFNIPKIVSNITKALHHLNMGGSPIYFHAYGDIQKIGEDVVKFVSESGFLIVGFRFCKSPNVSFDDDLEDDLSLRSDFSRPSAINIVISDGYGYPCGSLNSLHEYRNIILPYEILLYEGPQVSDLRDDLFEDDENIFLEHHMEFEYPVGHGSPDHKRSVNIWWDAGRCPPPVNFDVSKIGITIVEVMRLLNTSSPIYLRVYGNRRELLPKMAKDTKRIISKSGFELASFKLKDNSNVSDFILKGFQRNRKYFPLVLEENLMMEDLIYYGIRYGAPPQAIHLVVLDNKLSNYSNCFG